MLVFPSIIVAGLLALATHAGNAKADLLWGANGHPLVSYPGTSIQQQLDYLKDLGLRSYRVDIGSTSQLSKLAELVREGKARDIEILPVIVPAVVDLDKDSEEQLYRKAFDLAVGLITPLKNDIRTWELGNEMENYAIIQPCEMRDDGVQYNCAWGPAGGVGPLEYYGPRWRKASAVLKGLSDGAISVDPTIRKAMGTAGWGHTGAFTRMQQDGIRWDISVWHLYGDDPEWAFKILAEFKRPIWVTEFNNPYGSQKSEQSQVDGITHAINRLRSLSHRYNIEAAHIYELLDEPYWAPSFEAFMGLVRMVSAGEHGWRTGDPKPAYHVVKQLIRGGNTAPSVARKCDLGAHVRLGSTTRNRVSYAYCLILGRQGDGRGLDDYTAMLRQGLPVFKLLRGMLESDEFRSKYSTFGLSNSEFITLTYQLMLGRDPDGAGLAGYLALLDAGSINRADLAESIAGSSEFLSRHPALFH